LLELESRWANTTDAEKASASPLRIPLNGGELFVSADSTSPLAMGIQADLNAAANIGLRALMDPDFPGRWWYVPCDRATRQPNAEKVKGSILEGVGRLAPLEHSGPNVKAPTGRRKGSGRATTVREREIVNLWRDPQAGPICGAEGSGTWLETPHYWNIVKCRLIRSLRLGNQSGGM